MQRRLALTLSTVLATSLVSGGLAAIAVPASAATGGALLYGLTSSNHLVSFREVTPGTALSDVAISGLAGGESLLGLDVRPANGAVLALGSTGRLYSVDPTTGAATATTGATPTLSGTSFGLDVNPTVDRVRVVSDADQNLRLNPDTGAVAATDTALQYAAGDPNAAANPVVVAAAYTNSVAGAVGTQLFDLDTSTDALVLQNPPNNGTLTTIGALGVDATGSAGFDIDAATGKAFAVLTVGGNTGLYTVSLSTGAASLLGTAVAGLVDVTAPVVARPAYVLLTDNTLAKFDTSRAATVGMPVAITGTGGADVVGIDVRPATGVLYAVTADSKLYTVDPVTGVATQVGATAFTTALSGTAFGVDFNPVPDRLRIVSDTGQNLRINPNTGAVAAVDTNLNGAATTAVGAGYTNSFPGSTATTLYDVDAATDSLYLQNPPNAGTLVLVGALGVNVDAGSDLDIAPDGNIAYSVLTVGGVPSLYRINLTTGAATSVAPFSSALVEDLALVASGSLTAAAVSTDEAQSSVTVTVTRNAGSAGLVGVDYTTGGGTATAGSDYTATSGTLRFADGETSKTFSVPLAQDTLTEGAETFVVTFSNELGGTAPVAPATVTIADDDPGKAFALTTANEIATFAVSTPGTFSSTVAVTGLSVGDDLVGIDVRPATGDLIALGSSGRLYVVNPATGAATATTGSAPTLTGAVFGFDVNPVPDRVRVVSDLDQNLRLNPDTGALAATDTNLAYAGTDPNAAANPNVVGAAYTNSFAGTTTTTLYDIDSTLNVLVTQNPPNAGTLNTVGALGVDVTASGDLDIAANGNAAFAALTPAAGVPTLYRVDLSTGALSSLGAFATATVEDLALASPGRVGFTSTTATVGEAGPSVTLTVARTGGTTGPVGVSYATSDATGTAGSDYTATSGTLSFADGETSKTVVVPVAQDAFVEGQETFKVTLSAPTGGAGLGTAPVATVTVTDDESGVAYALTAGNSLYAFNPVNPSAPGQVLRPIAGLSTGERVLGIDVRPANGLLYGITSSSRVLIIDPATGATQLASTSSALVSGASFGVDFNPVADRLRVVSDAGQNLRINVDTGAATVDTALAYATGDAGAGMTPAVSAAGYTGSAQGATATALFDIDLARDVIVAQAPPNNGTLTTVGALGFDATSAGLDIVSPGDSAFAVLTPAGGVPGLYRLSTATGANNLLGALPDATTTDVALATPAAAAAGRYHALAPARLLDTRSTGGPVAAGADRTVQVTGVGGVPSTGVSAVAVNVTVVGGTLKGNLAVYPTGQQPSTRTSNLNYAKGQTIAVQVQTGVGTGGAISVSTATGSAQVIVDVLGWYGTSTDTAGQGYQSLTPSRLLDTRTTSRVARGADHNVQVTGLGGVPEGATAVAVNVTATGATGNLYVGLYPGGAKPSSPTSTLNVVVGQTVANSSVVTLGTDGSLGVTVGTFASHVIIDVVGYYGPTGAGRFVPLTPSRLLDQRTSNTPVTSTQDSTLTVAGAGGVPATGVGAAALSVTGTLAGTAGYVQAYPTDALPAAPTSTLNIVPGTDVANLAVSSLGTGGAVSFKTSSTYVFLIVDVTGYFTLS